MKTNVQIAIAAALAGSVVGSLAGLRWLVVLASQSPAGLPSIPFLHGLSIFTAVLLTLAVYVSWTLTLRILSPRPAIAATTLLSVIAGILAHISLSAIFAAAAVGSPQLPLSVFLAAILVALGAAARGFRRFALAAIVIAAAAIPCTRSLALITGDQLSLASAAYAPPIASSYYGALAASLALLSLSIAAFASPLLRLEPLRASTRALGIGALLFLIIAASQTAAYYASMGSGQNPLAIYVAITLPWVLLAPAVLLSLREWALRRPSFLLKYAPALILVLVSGYAFVACYGYCDYKIISRLYPDGATAYIHFTSDGASNRTLDSAASSTKAWRAQYFLTAYPYSAYRPAASLAAAECAFEEWDFDQAGISLERMRGDYPFLDGYREVLGVLSGLAAGNPESILRPVSPESYLAKWRATQGAQLAAEAASRLGLPNRARGYASAYIDYLTTQHSASWTRQSLAVASSRLAYLTQVSLSHADLRQSGTVDVTVLAGNQAVVGARVILVQPHPDAALPADSRQFTGAWTLPAWNGIWATTDEHGHARVERVPYGRYEIVLGLDARLSPLGYVVATRASSVTLNTNLLQLPPIRLVPAIRLLSPSAGESVGTTPRLRWAPYPDAHSYSVSLIELAAAHLEESSAPGQPTGTTCWARSDIHAARALVDSAAFLPGHTHLKPGASYMWIVYAYRADGALLASSEHYFQSGEPTFTVR